MVADGWPDHPEGCDADAELRGGADASWPPVPRRRCGAYRAANGCERTEPGGVGCPGARASIEGVLRAGLYEVAGRLLRRLPAPCLESAAVLVVDDIDAASLTRRQRVRPSASNR